MNIFDVVPHELFTILASPNKIIYSDALLVLYDAFQENLKIPRDTLFSMIRSRLENALIQSSFEDEDIEEEESQDLSGKARFLIRKLKEKGWIDIERDSDFSEFIIIPEYSIRIIELLRSLIDGESSIGFSYVYDTYSALKIANVDENAGAYEKMIAIDGAYDRTISMVKALKKVYHNINRYVQQLIDNDDINNILSAHYDDFYRHIIETCIQPLKIKDSIPKYKNPIHNILEDWLRNEELINEIVKVSSEEKRNISQEVHKYELQKKIFFIMETFETLETNYLYEIDEKIRKYTRATTKKIEYLTNTDRTAQGNLIYLLNALAASADDYEIVDDIQSALNLFRQEYHSENSLYSNRRARRRQMQDPVLIEESDNDLNKKIKDEYKDILISSYNKEKVMEYVERMFGESPVAFSSDIEMQDDHTYILSLLAALHGNDRGVFYKTEFLDSIISGNEYSLPEIRFERKKGK